MIKQEIENKLDDIVDRYENFYLVAKEAFNLGLEIAAENVQTKPHHEYISKYDDYETTMVIDKDSILKYKL